MTDNEQRAFSDLTRRPELRGLGNNEPFGPEIFYGLLAMAVEILAGGLGALLLSSWKILVAALIVVITTLLVIVAIAARRNT